MSIDWTKMRTAANLAAEKAEAELEARKSEARRYLAETDWLVTRQAETKKPIPKGTLDQRAAARSLLSE